MLLEPPIQRCGADEVGIQQLTDRVNMREILIDVRKDHAKIRWHMGRFAFGKAVVLQQQ